jgi:hypothetical protein
MLFIQALGIASSLLGGGKAGNVLKLATGIFGGFRKKKKAKKHARRVARRQRRLAALQAPPEEAFEALPLEYQGYLMHRSGLHSTRLFRR